MSSTLSPSLAARDCCRPRCGRSGPTSAGELPTSPSPRGLVCQRSTSSSSARWVISAPSPAPQWQRSGPACRASIPTWARLERSRRPPPARVARSAAGSSRPDGHCCPVVDRRLALIGAVRVRFVKTDGQDAESVADARDELAAQLDDAAATRDETATRRDRAGAERNTRAEARRLASGRTRDCARIGRRLYGVLPSHTLAPDPSLG